MQVVLANPKRLIFNSDVDSSADSATGGTTLPGSISGRTPSNQGPFGTCGYAPSARSRRIHSPKRWWTVNQYDAPVLALAQESNDFNVHKSDFTQVHE